MKNSTEASIAAAAVALALGLSAPAADAGNSPTEKCFGVSKAGQNDCASVIGTHSCAGQSMKDNDPNEWKYVPKGSCEKLGGTTAIPKGTK